MEIILFSNAAAQKSQKYNHVLSQQKLGLLGQLHRLLMILFVDGPRVFTGKWGYWSYCMLLCPFEFCYLRIPNIKVFTSTGSCFRKNDGFMIMNSKYNYSRWGRRRQIANNSEPLDFSKISSMSIILRHIHSYWSWFEVYHCITLDILHDLLRRWAFCVHVSGIVLKNPSAPAEPRKKNPLLSMKYWLFNRDPQ